MKSLTEQVSNGDIGHAEYVYDPKDLELITEVERLKERVEDVEIKAEVCITDRMKIDQTLVGFGYFMTVIYVLV